MSGRVEKLFPGVLSCQRKVPGGEKRGVKILPNNAVIKPSF